jgi:protein-S-isoprenylcysteine O-methyltransferase Ste14
MLQEANVGVCVTQGKAVNALTKRALLRLLWFQAALAVLLFLPAWSLRFWEAWGYWIIFSASSLGITLYFLQHDPALIERRMTAGPGAEQEKSQKIIQALASVLVCAIFIVPGVDHRLHWSSVPTPVVVLADVLVVAGFLTVFRVFQENSYAAGTVRVEAHQQVITTGPYQCVRHPMYAGAMLLFLATPLALGSWWTLPLALALGGVIVARLREEEEYLSKNLPGYDAYRQKVQERLIPYIW